MDRSPLGLYVKTSIQVGTVHDLFRISWCHVITRCKCCVHVKLSCVSEWGHSLRNEVLLSRKKMLFLLHVNLNAKINLLPSSFLAYKILQVVVYVFVICKIRGISFRDFKNLEHVRCA